MPGMSKGPLDGGWSSTVLGGDFLVEVVVPEISREELIKREVFRSTGTQTGASQLG